MLKGAENDRATRSTGNKGRKSKGLLLERKVKSTCPN